MEYLLWLVAAGGAVLLVAIMPLIAPARTTIIVDTPTSIARAEIRLLWGLGPAFTAYALSKSGAGNPLASFTDAARIGQALMTPGIADVSYMALQRLFRHDPGVARVELAMSLDDPAQSRVVQTAVQAALAAAPQAVRQSVVLSKSETPGAELIARFELNIPPARLRRIYHDLKNSRPAREFRRRLNRKPKTSKKAPREVAS